MLDWDTSEKPEKAPKPRAAKPESALIAIPYFHLDLSPDHVDLFGFHYWEMRSPWSEGGRHLNTGVAPRVPIRVSLSGILETNPDPKYYLTKTACKGILRRAEERGKELPEQLKQALMIQAGLATEKHMPSEVKAYHINQRDEGIDLNGVSGALMATNNMQMQTFVTQPENVESIGFDGYNGDLTGKVTSTLGINCGMSTGRNGVMNPIAFAANQRQDKGASVLCLNDQGGQFMSCSTDITGTLRSQMNQHQPLILESNQDHATVRTDGTTPTLPASMGMGGGYVPMVYENHGIDSRYTGPHSVSPTISARCGTGGNNLPLVEQESICIVGNVIDRQPKNGGNGCGYQKELAYTLTGMDRHAVYSRQRTDQFKENDVVCTESARQHKDATDLVVQPYQQTVGTIGYSDHHGINNQYVGEDKCVIESPNLIRRLTPLECERLQGFPDYWTDIPGASDSARYKALGNSVAIPCVDFVMNGMAVALRREKAA